MIGHKAHFNKTQYSYWISQPDAPTNHTILLIHGFGGTYSGLEELSELLSQNFAVLGVDLPGYGLSEPLRGRHTLEAYAQFLDHFCTEVGYQRITVVGHSFGADIALVFAAKYPNRIKKLVLLNPVIVSSRPMIKMGKHYYKLVAKAPYVVRHWLLHNHLLTWMSAQMLFKTASSRTRSKILRDDYISDHLMTDRPVIESYYSLLSTKFFARAKRITAPTLISSGSSDSLSPESDMNQLHSSIKHSELQILPGEGHFMPIESPKLVYDLLQKFLKN